jgi:dCMP deaminase
MRMLENMEQEERKIDRIERTVPNWDESYLLDALYWSHRSHDAQTQCGCVLVGPDKVMISHGYNGFMRDIDSSSFPNTRPKKYPFMFHSEENAVLNACRQGKKTLGATAYITTEPCNICLQLLWQVGISRIVYSNFSYPNMMKNKEFEEVKKIIMEAIQDKIIIDFIPASNLSGIGLEASFRTFQKHHK